MAILGSTIVNGDLTTNGTINATSIKKIGGTSSQYLRADGSTGSVVTSVNGSTGAVSGLATTSQLSNYLTEVCMTSSGSGKPYEVYNGSITTGNKTLSGSISYFDGVDILAIGIYTYNSSNDYWQNYKEYMIPTFPLTNYLKNTNEYFRLIGGSGYSGYVDIYFPDSTHMYIKTATSVSGCYIYVRTINLDGK